MLFTIEARPDVSVDTLLVLFALYVLLDSGVGHLARLLTLKISELVDSCECS
jgi:hypothetical protein